MLRYLASPRWIFWHVFCLVLVTAMIILGYLQWQAALAPNSPGGSTPWRPRNLVYAVQWWIFAGFAAWFWHRFLRDQREADLAADEAEFAVEPLPNAAGGTER